MNEHGPGQREPTGAASCVRSTFRVTSAGTRRHAQPQRGTIEMCHLCTGRQADYVPDPWTEARKVEVLAELWAAERAMQSARSPVNRVRSMFASCTATGATYTWRPEE